MSYARVVWYEKDRNVEYEEVVPSKWIDSNGTTLHWPVDIKSVPNAIRERFSPQKNWKKFNIKKTKCLDSKLVRSLLIKKVVLVNYIYIFKQTSQL